MSDWRARQAETVKLTLTSHERYLITSSLLSTARHYVALADECEAGSGPNRKMQARDHRIGAREILDLAFRASPSKEWRSCIAGDLTAMDRAARERRED